jgi:uncharacterized protein YecE (DUF72 family)
VAVPSIRSLMEGSASNRKRGPAISSIFHKGALPLKCVNASCCDRLKRVAHLYAGTSGFAYASWKPAFYPAKLPASKFLTHYASRLNCVEVNYTFRTVPASSTLAKWVESTPEHFVFCPKAHMRITHILKLRDAAQFTEVFLKAIDPLRIARRIGPILFQLPPSLKCDVELLKDYLAILPADLQYAFEFRHASWLSEHVYETLRRQGAALCIAESENLETPEVLTANFAYFRLRKPDYLPDDVARVAANARYLLEEGNDLYVFFKHEKTPEGALNAEQLLRAIVPQTPTTP